MFAYLISLIARDGRNIDKLDVVTVFLNSDIEDDDIYITLLEGWQVGLNAPKIIVRLRNALYGVNPAPRLWLINFNSFLLSLGFTQSSADSNLYLGSNGILMLPYVNDITILYLEATTEAAIKDKLKFVEKYLIKNFAWASHFLGFEIYHNAFGTGISLG
jgi:hypothetical protein